MNTLSLTNPPQVADPPPAAPSQGGWVFVAEAVDTRGLAVHWCAPLVHPGDTTPHLIAELVQDAGARVYARGAIRHPDHATIHLGDWHRVFRRPQPAKARPVAEVAGLPYPAVDA